MKTEEGLAHDGAPPRFRRALAWLWTHRQAIVPPCIAIIGLALLWPESQMAKLFSDSKTYINWAPTRLPTYCTFVTIFGHGRLLCYVQAVVSITAWCFFGWVVAGIPGTAIAACVAVSAAIAQWNQMVLSESLSFSLIAATMGTTLLLLRGWSALRFALWSLLALALAFTKICEFYLLPFLPLPFLFFSWRRFVLVAAVSLSIFATAIYVSNTRGARYLRVALTDVIMYRVLPDPEARAYFAERGMPCGPEVMKYQGRRRSKFRNPLWKDSPAFEAWLTPRGVRAYQVWLLTHWAPFRDPWQALPKYRARPAWYHKHTQIRPIWVTLIDFYLFIGRAPTWVWLLVLFLPLVDWLTTRRVVPLAAMGAMLVLATYAEAFVVFNGECDEMSRLMMPVGILYRMSLAVGVAWTVDWVRRLLANRWRVTRPSGPEL